MHDIEPFDLWRDEYEAAEDRRSPFYGRQYSETQYTSTIYNYYIHPQWDSIGSSTLYCKVLFTDYGQAFTVIELMGEWNDALHNDIMFLKRELIDPLINEGICKFLLIGENVLNFHRSDDAYYEEWHEEVRDAGGWIVAANFREHVMSEMDACGMDAYVDYRECFAELEWRKLKPGDLSGTVERLRM